MLLIDVTIECAFNLTYILQYTFHSDGTLSTHISKTTLNVCKNNITVSQQGHWVI